MTAQLLREAAALMRERALGATPGPWEVHADRPIVVRANWTERSAVVEGYKDAPGERDLVQVASWHPVVAHAVADWLEAEAGAVEFDGGRPDLLSAGALTVARTYLGDLL